MGGELLFDAFTKLKVLIWKTWFDSYPKRMNIQLLSGKVRIMAEMANTSIDSNVKAKQMNYDPKEEFWKCLYHSQEAKPSSDLSK